MPLYCDQVIDVVRRSLHPMTARTVARHLGLPRRVVRASLKHASNCVDRRLEMVVRSPENTKRRRHVVWRYAAPAAA